MLRAVLDEPAEDAPRLVYADWLEENGLDLRAEFIRVQVAEARLGAKCPHEVVGRPGEYPISCGHCDWYVLRWRAEAIHGTRGVLGLERCPCASRLWPMWEGLPSPGPVPLLVWRRGFVEEIRGPLWAGRRPSMIQALRKVCPSHPVTLVRLTGPAPMNLTRNTGWFWLNGGPLSYLSSRSRRSGLGTDRPRWRTAGPTDFLPAPIWERLRGYESIRRTESKGYPTEEAALAALSGACVAFGRVERQGAKVTTG